MAYIEFLVQWFNLPYVVAVVIGAVRMFRPKVRIGSDWAPAAAFITGITGLTLNGAIHDLGFGTPTGWFPLVFSIAAVTGIGLAFTGARILRRAFPPVTGVTWNEPGLEGSVAQIVTGTAGPDSPSGRARVRDESGVVHIIRIYTPGASLRFGRRVRLGLFDDARRAYPVEPV